MTCSPRFGRHGVRLVIVVGLGLVVALGCSSDPQCFRELSINISSLEGSNGFATREEALRAGLSHESAQHLPAEGWYRSDEGDWLHPSGWTAGFQSVGEGWIFNGASSEGC